ncbi:MAG: hypothetical protein ABJH63_01530 [Rhizobiaceae bacterium]
MKRILQGLAGGFGRVTLVLAAVIILLGGGVYLSGNGNTLAQMMHHGGGQYEAGQDGAGHHGQRHQGQKHHGMRHHGSDGTGHDMKNMPGLQGLDATQEESTELAKMFRNFPDISREVTKLPDGIRTVTYSANEELMDVITSHVVGMINRVEEGRDPKIFIQSPTLDIIFERADKIKTDIDSTDEGVVVVQTSTDPEVVKALHTHADEVTEMVERGMQAVHEKMMDRHHN